MANTIKPDALGDAIAKELTLYGQDVVDRVNVASKNAAEELVTITKATAPKKTGSFRRHIACKLKEQSRTGDETYVWYVKAPDYRLTHLLVHGHATTNGKRVPGNPFLHNAVDAVLPEYEKALEEAVKE